LVKLQSVGAANTPLEAECSLGYEVVGLRQNDQTDQMDYPIRNSGSVFITVPWLTG
jgi:hypothetical protein